MTSINCPNCQTVIEQTYEFCPKCGTRIVIEQPKQVEVFQQTDPEPEEVKSISVENSTPYKEKYSSGVKTTFIWSTVLSLITLLFYTFKGMANVDIVAQNLIQGVFARPLVVLFIAFIISIFFKSEEKKISKFNSVCTFVMAILTLGELGRWFVIGGA